jgi:hypothetical protein
MVGARATRAGQMGSEHIISISSGDIVTPEQSSRLVGIGGTADMLQ